MFRSVNSILLMAVWRKQHFDLYVDTTKEEERGRKIRGPHFGVW